MSVKHLEFGKHIRFHQQAAQLSEQSLFAGSILIESSGLLRREGAVYFNHDTTDDNQLKRANVNHTMIQTDRSERISIGTVRNLIYPYRRVIHILYFSSSEFSFTEMKKPRTILATYFFGIHCLADSIPPSTTQDHSLFYETIQWMKPQQEIGMSQSIKTLEELKPAAERNVGKIVPHVKDVTTHKDTAPFAEMTKTPNASAVTHSPWPKQPHAQVKDKPHPKTAAGGALKANKPTVKQNANSSKAPQTKHKRHKHKAAYSPSIDMGGSMTKAVQARSKAVKIL